MDKLQIIEYSAPYKEAILDLIIGIQRHEFGLQIRREDQPDLDSIPAYYQSGNGNFWVALYHNQVIGTIGLLDIGNRQAALRKMFVKKEYRGKQYQTANHLLNALLTWCRLQNISVIYLGTTNRFLAAHRFYEKNGFQPITVKELPDKFPIMKVDTRFYRYVL